jgi:phenylpyruvate tautomerase PptA (4-oxalocrotonate tautomerase family)
MTMPMIDLTLMRGSLAPEAAAALADRLTLILLRWEGAPDNPAARSISWAFVHAVDAVRVGGAASEAPRYRVQATVPQGVLNDEKKAGLAAEITEAVLAAEGSAPSDPARVWCIIHEVPDGNWAGGGRIHRLKDISAFVRRGERRVLS